VAVVGVYFFARPNLDYFGPKTMSDRINFVDFFQRLQLHEESVSQVKGRSLVMMIGRSGVGKSALGCFLIGRDLILKEESFVTNTGTTRRQSYVTTLNPQPGDFVIGTRSDSETKCISALPLFGHPEILFADTCGFWDPEGFTDMTQTVNIVNAIGLRNAMRACSDFRVILFLDIGEIDANRSVAFCEFLNLLIRFFNPISSFFDSMILYFRPHGPVTDHDVDRLAITLDQLSKSNAMSQRVEHLAIIQWIAIEVDKRGKDMFFVYDSPDQAQAREDMIKNILQTTTGFERSFTLGCPLSNESLNSLCNQIRELTLETMSCFRQHQYAEVNTNITWLNQLKDSLPIPEMIELAEGCLEEIGSMIEDMQNSATINFENLDFPHLRIELSRLQQARVIKYFKLENDFNERVGKLNTLLKTLASQVLDQPEVNLESLNRMYQMKLYFITFLHDEVNTSYGYDAICATLANRILEADQFCSQFLVSFKQALREMNPQIALDFPQFFSKMEVLRVGMSLSQHVQTQHRRYCTEYDLLLISHRAEITNQILEFCALPNSDFISPESNQIIQNLLVRQQSELRIIPPDHGPDMYRIHFEELRQELEFTMNYCQGLLLDMQSCTFSSQQRDHLSCLHSLVQGCYQNGASFLFVGSQLANLDNLVVNQVVQCLGSHLATVDTMYLRRDFLRLSQLLAVLTSTQLNDEAFVLFKSSSIDPKINYLTENFTGEKKKLEQQLLHLHNRDPLEETDVLNVVDQISMMQTAKCLDTFLFPEDPTMTGDSSISHWCENAIHSLSDVWTTAISNFPVALNSSNSNLVRSAYGRLNNLALATKFLSSAEPDLKRIFQKIENLATSVVTTIPKIPSNMEPQLRCHTTLIDLLPGIEDCRVIKEVVALDSQWCENHRRALSIWLNDVQTFVRDILQKFRQDINAQFTALKAQEFADLLDEMRDFCRLDVYLQPPPSLLYKATLSDIRTFLKVRCDIASQRGDVSILADLRGFVSNAHLFQSHFENIKFEDYVFELDFRYRGIVEDMPDEVIKYLQEKRYRLLRRNLSMLKSSSDPADQSMFFYCDAEVSAHLTKIKDSVDHLNDDLVNEFESIDGLIKLFENCHEVMVLSDVISYNIIDLLKYVATILLELFLKIKRTILDDLNKYRFVDASHQYSVIRRFRRCDLPFGNYPNLTECAPFGPKIDKLWVQFIQPVPENIVDECQKYFLTKLEEMEKMDLEQDTANLDPKTLDDLLDEKPRSLLYSADDYTLFSDDSYLEKLISSSIGSDGHLFDRRLDFDKTKREIVKIVNAYTNKLIKTMQDKIFCMDLRSAKIRAEAGSTLLSTPKIEHYLSLPTIDRFRLQLKSLNLAETNGQFIHYRFDATDMEKVKKHLEEQRRMTFESYFTGYEKLKQQFLQERATFIELLSKAHTSREINAIFLFMTALNKYDDLIVDPRVDAESPRLVLKCRQDFEEFLDHEIWNCLRNVKNAKDVQLTQNRVLALGAGLQMLIKVTTNTTSKEVLVAYATKCTECEEKGIILLKNIEMDRKVLGVHDLFARQNMALIASGLERLRQNPGQQPFDDGGMSYDEVKSNLKSQLSIADERFQTLLQTSFPLTGQPDYENCLNGILNIRELGANFSPLRENCTEAIHKILFIVASERNRLSQLVTHLFRSKNFNVLNETIVSAAAMDECLLKQIPRSDIPLLMPEMIANFTSELSALTERMSRSNSSIDDHVETILMIKQCVSEISQSDIQALAFNHIGEYLVVLAKKKIDIYQLGKTLSDRGPVGVEVTEQYPQFKAIIAKRRNQLTAHITFQDAVAYFVKLNPNMPPDSAPALLRLGTLFSDQYEAALKQYLEGYGTSFTYKPLHRLVESVQRRAQECRTNPSPNDIVFMLSGIFATWTVMSSSDMFTSSSQDPDCVTKPHPIQLIAIFRLLGIDSADGFWTTIYKAVGLKQKVLEGHLIQVSSIL
jgi:hypothetical protein